jgi:hypothetical protein
MRTIMQALLALGFVGAMTVTTPATTKAQGVSIYGPGVEVDVGARRYPYRSYDRDRYYRDYNNSYGYYGGYYRSRYRSCPPDHTMRNGICIRIRY